VPSFAYVAKDASGARVEGVLDVDTAAAAAKWLREAGRVPLRIAPAASGGSSRRPMAVAGARFAPSPQAGAREAAGGRAARGAADASSRPATEAPGDAGSALDVLRRLAGSQKVGAVELQMFTRELHALLKAGVTVMRALDLLREATASRPLADLLGSIRAQLDAGVDLPDAFERENERAKVFSPYYLAILRVGSFTGRLDECLLRLAQFLEFQRATREQVAAALRYPSFVVLAAIAAIVVINLFVLPQFEKVFAGMKATLPLMTRILLGGSHLFVQWWWAVAAVVAGLAFAARRGLATPDGRAMRDRFLLRAPIVGELVERTCLARFAHGLALAMRSGVPLVQGLEIVSKTIDNVVYERAVLEMRDRVERGDSIRSAAAGTGVFPRPVLQVIAVGEETGAFDTLLEELGDFYRSEVAYATSRLSARLEPILITGLGVVVLVLALGVFMPMWELGRAAMGKG
jgi:MSHA biogenesis protein MshG